MKKINKKYIFIIISIFLIVTVISGASVGIFYSTYYVKSPGSYYDVLQIDLSLKPDFIIDSKYDYLYKNIDIDLDSAYMAHPDSIIIDNNIVTTYVDGHGRGALLTKVSSDGGLTYSNRLTTTPSSWKFSEETPTYFRLDFKNNETRYILVSANPKWPGYITGDGFNVSISQTSNYLDFSTWSEFKKFYGKDDKTMHVSPIVAMSSLIHLKENGEFVDKWMGIFHDNKFRNYKTILTFDENNQMQWSKPEEYFKGENEKYFSLAKKTQMCEVLMFRNDNNQGDVLCLITRSNTKKCNSLISFSYDEGETWTKPKEIFSALNGERHKLVYLNDGRIAITFRSIIRNPKNSSYYSEGWVMWIGTWDHLINYYEGNLVNNLDNISTKNQYRIKVAHTYLDGQIIPELKANGDTGYCGNVVLEDGTIVTTSYGKFYSDLQDKDGLKTVIVSKRIKIEDIDSLYNLYLANK